MSGMAAATAILADQLGLFGSPAANASTILWNYPMTNTVPKYDGFPTRPNGTGHTGQDYSNGTSFAIYSVAGGVVTRVQDNDSNADVFGNYVKINHGSDSDGSVYESYYGHMAENPPFRVGQFVGAGALLGHAGRTSYGGNGVGLHLHISILKNGTLVDPVPIIDNAPRVGSPGVPISDPNSQALAGDNMAILRRKTSDNSLVLFTDFYAVNLNRSGGQPHPSENTYIAHYSPDQEPADIGSDRVTRLKEDIKVQRDLLVSEIAVEVVRLINLQTL
jgi:hypothetical protein